MSSPKKHNYFNKDRDVEPVSRSEALQLLKRELENIDTLDDGECVEVLKETGGAPDRIISMDGTLVIRQGEKPYKTVREHLARRLREKIALLTDSD